ncbi:MAG TPA: dihydrolipoamide acetyltransferase family protein [Stellaceae bacterium]|nr:dihydrolipoamide acetyltransferase family protein [Stellaceae bacterium]
MSGNEITMPKLSDTMEEGKILRWLKHPGDTIHRGDAIAEVETDKADMVMEAFDDGVLDEIRLMEGESAKVGEVIAVLRSADAAHAPAGASASPAQPAAEAQPTRVSAEPLAEVEEPEPAGEAVSATDGFAVPEPQVHPALSANPSAVPTAIAAPPRPKAVAVATPPQSPAVGEHAKFRASPLARRTAEEAGLDLNEIQGSGPEGRITKRDIDDFIREQQLFRFRRLIAPREGAPGTREELSKMRKTIAQRMAQSKREIPHFYVTIEVDMEEAVKLKNSLEATELFEEDITYNDIIIKATALALSRYTRMNASFEDNGVIIYPHINIGMAVAVEDGLIVPVIHECERLTLPEIARAAHRLVAKAARGGFSGDDLSSATFTISNMGMLGVEHFAAVIVPPQAAILAVSAIKDRPVVRNGQLAIGKTMMVTVACDHRIIDGVIGARFLNEMKRFLENPASLLV